MATAGGSVPKVVAVEFCNIAAEPRPDDTPDRYAYGCYRYDELDVMRGDSKAPIAQCLQKSNLLTFKRDNPAECDIDQEGCHKEKDRR